MTTYKNIKGRRNLTLILIIVVVTFASCNNVRKNTVKKGTPQCVENKIKDFTSPCGDANAKEYTFRGKTVFVFEQGTCGGDLTSEVIDADCNSLGYLGGITGNRVINGEDFSNAVFIKIIWTK